MVFSATFNNILYTVTEPDFLRKQGLVTSYLSQGEIRGRTKFNINLFVGILFIHISIV